MKVGNINISGLTLSASKFETYRKCPKQFKYQYLWKVPGGTTSIPMYKGSIFHSIVQKAGKEQMQGRLLKRAELEKLFAAEWDYRQFFDHTKKDERDGRMNVKHMLG